MRTLYLIRHAKSDWNDPAMSDFDRPLNHRGEQNAPFMANVLKKQKIRPDLIVSSPALRAKMTAEAIAGSVGYDKGKIVYENTLYLAGIDEIERVVRALPPSCQSVFLIAHNPGLTLFAEHISGRGIGNIPTCGIVAVSFAEGGWKEASKDSARFLFFDFPKKHPRRT